MSASLSVAFSFAVGVSLFLLFDFFADLRAERVFLEGVSALAGVAGATTGEGGLSTSTSCSASDSSNARASNAPLEANRDFGAIASVLLVECGGAKARRSSLCGRGDETHVGLKVMLKLNLNLT